MKKKEFKLDVLTQKRTIKQYQKFFVSGLICAVINLSILYTSTELIGIHYILSAVIAAAISSTCNFVFNKTWTFKEDFEDKFFEKYLKFGVVRVVVVGIGLILLFLLTEYAHIYYIYSQIIAIAVVGTISFIAHKVWVFEKYRLGEKK